MRYTLEELLNDKELRKQLLETAFTFSDDEGDFFVSDAVSLSTGVLLSLTESISFSLLSFIFISQSLILPLL